MAIDAVSRKLAQKGENVPAINDVLAQPTGAKFWRADLHIHSFGSSHDVKDSTMTAEAIVETALAEGLNLISIADHNEIDSVEIAIAAARGTSVCVIPGIELSTGQGHLLCYLPTLDALRRFHGQLNIVDRRTQNSRCQQSALDCLNLLIPLGGFGILAHVDVASGFEVANPGASPHKADVLCHPALLGIELKHAESPISYSATDPDGPRAGIGRDRITRLKLGSRQYLARVLNSDAHALVALGRNAASQQRVTRFKMDAPSFQGLRLALEDADARVRIEDLIPSAIPRIVGAALEGGFLHGQLLHFSSNLNCIIGGRGTGKSTIFEAIRCIAHDRSNNKVIDSEVWPDELSLVWCDQAGRQHVLSRLKDGETQNVNDPDAGPLNFDVDCFGQGEAAKISMEAQADPLALLRYLDKFVDLAAATADEEAARERLLVLQTEIEKAEQQVALIPQYDRLLETTKQQLSALQKPEVKDLIELARHLATEKEIRKQIGEKLQEAKESVEHATAKTSIGELRALADPARLTVGVAEFNAIVAGAATFEAAIGAAETQLKDGLVGFERTVKVQIASWKTKETEAQKKVDDKRRELEALKVLFDMSYIAKLAKDEAAHEQKLKALKSWGPHLVEQRRLRGVALKERWVARTRVATIRDAFGRQASTTLRESLTDLKVSLKYTPNAFSPEGTEQIIQAMGWRTNQQPRAKRLIEDLTLPVLLEAIQKNDLTQIMALQTPEGIAVFDRNEAQQILEKLSAPTVKFALERAKLYDLPRLQVAKAISDGNGGQRHIVRDFSKLSLGQQQSVLLALILSSDSTKPLIIDQPEDNLDGEFIYSTLVPVLRRAKERRQVIIVTHNPNVAVLGDAELIIVMRAFNDRGEIKARGSIDHVETRDEACAILEGAREAFLRRAKIYGLSIANH